MYKMKDFPRHAKALKESWFKTKPELVDDLNVTRNLAPDEKIVEDYVKGQIDKNSNIDCCIDEFFYELMHGGRFIPVKDNSHEKWLDAFYEEMCVVHSDVVQ